MRILLVEDDRSIREVVELGLQRAGFAVTPVGDGREALDRFRAGGHAAIVLDVMLPSLDGLEVCREIRRTSQVPIIMLTARAETPRHRGRPRAGGRRLRHQAVRGA